MKMIKFLFIKGEGPGLRSPYRDLLQPGRSGIEFRWEGETFRTRPDRSWRPPSLLYSGNGSFPGILQQGCGIDHPLHPAPRLKKE